MFQKVSQCSISYVFISKGCHHIEGPQTERAKKPKADLLVVLETRSLISRRGQSSASPGASRHESFLPPPASESPRCALPVAAKLQSLLPSSHIFPLVSLASYGQLLTAAAAAAAESLQSCPTLCDPIDGSPPGSPVPGSLQARALEWVAISFSNA